MLNGPISRKTPAGRYAYCLFMVAVGALLVVAASAGLAQQADTPAPGAGWPTTGEEQQSYETLRRLLGLPAQPPPAQPLGEPLAPAPGQPADEPPPPANALAQPAAPEPAPAEVATDKVAPAPVARPAAAPKKKANVVKSAPAPRAKPRVVVQGKPAAPEIAPPVAPQEAPAPPVVGSMDDLPPLGSVIAAADVERWKHLLGPSVQWSLQHGATIKVSAPVPIPLEAARARATELYHDQVELTADKMDMKNYVAGVPFPTVNPDDPDAGVKLMFNQQSRTVVDDVDARNIACQTGTIVPGRGVELEKQYVTGHWRRLFYVGRLYYDPKPAWKASDGARYRESQYPFIEPFDLKSGGWSYTRYLDPGRLDDAWLYYPITRRVRRMSTAQRSQGVFGQDMDLDSLAGFSGNPAWTEWHLLGVKTVLAAMHAKHSPVGWQKAPADFVFDEEWEPRQVYVILGRSRLPDYGFSQRVIYVDRESYLIPYSEIYDLKGQLWKGLVQAWSFGATVRPDAGGASFEEFYLPGYAMIDMQLNHVTRCELPYRNAVGDKGWYYNHGNAEGVTEDSFAVSSLIGQAH